MELKEEKRNIITSGVTNESYFGISQDDQSHIITILRDKLYANKHAAIVREYATNAWDAHKDAKINASIKVTAPTILSPTLVIRDYGEGLSPEQITEVYTKYGRSTKRKSNEVVGQLGLGCKSAFAYTDSFTIVSYNQGTKYTYTCYLDETNVGKVALLGEEPTTQTGIEIHISIRTSDINAIQHECQKILKYFEPRVVCNIQIPQTEYTTRSKTWGVRKDGGAPQVIMGNIAYPIQIQHLTNLPKDLTSFIQIPLDIYLPIGSASISASREALEYKDNTKNSIYTVLYQVRDELTKGIDEEFSKVTSDIEYYKLRNTFSRSPQYISNYVQAKYNKDPKVSDKTFLSYSSPTDPQSSARWLYRSGNYKTFFHLESHVLNAIPYNVNYDNVCVIIGDVKSAYLERIKQTNYWFQIGTSYLTLYLENPNAISTDRNVVEKFVKDNLERAKLTGVPIVWLSDQAYNPKARYKSPNATGTPKEKVFSTDFLSNTFNKAKRSSNWEAEDIEFDENSPQIYVCLYEFEGQKPKDGGYYPLGTISLFLNAYNQLAPTHEQIPNFKLIGVKKELLSKVPTTWIEFGTFLHNVKQKISNSWTYQNLCRIKNYIEWTKYQYSILFDLSEKQVNSTNNKDVIDWWYEAKQLAWFSKKIDEMAYRQFFYNLSTNKDLEIPIHKSHTASLYENIQNNYKLLKFVQNTKSDEQADAITSYLTIEEKI